MKTFIDFVDALSGSGDVGARDQCSFCLSRKDGLTVFNLARELRELDLPSEGRPWAIHLCGTCSQQYERLFSAMKRDNKPSPKPKTAKAKSPRTLESRL